MSKRRREYEYIMDDTKMTEETPRERYDRLVRSARHHMLTKAITVILIVWVIYYLANA